MIIAKVQEWLGHANIATTRTYDHRRTHPEDGPTFEVAYWGGACRRRHEKKRQALGGACRHGDAHLFLNAMPLVDASATDAHTLGAHPAGPAARRHP